MAASAKPERQSFTSSYTPAPGHRYDVGDRVVVKRAFPPGHRRTPYYIRGKQGVIERICGAFPNPEELAYGFSGKPGKTLYRVRFPQQHVWPRYAGPSHDIIEMEIFEHWLEPASAESPAVTGQTP
ncbi:MAG: nitrile hydratase subunit beta [Betaproteobacteria bacterium]|nr:nitrile hydratase subunit beta [Betaproteobacteria bacterium]